MKVTEGWRRTFIVLSVVYWLPAIYASFELAINENTPTPWDSLLMINLIISALIYGALAGLVAGVIWIMAGFSKSKPERGASANKGSFWILAGFFKSKPDAE